MGELVTINFRSRAIRTDRAREAMRDCLKAFDQTGTYNAALKLCRLLLRSPHSDPSGSDLKFQRTTDARRRSGWRLVH